MFYWHSTSQIDWRLWFLFLLCDVDTEEMAEEMWWWQRDFKLDLCQHQGSFCWDHGTYVHARTHARTHTGWWDEPLGAFVFFFVLCSHVSLVSFIVLAICMSFSFLGNKHTYLLARLLACCTLHVLALFIVCCFSVIDRIHMHKCIWQNFQDIFLFETRTGDEKMTRIVSNVLVCYTFFREK